mgnify:CR=1 FL=1
MHLDTVFTQVSEGECLCYAPMILAGGAEDDGGGGAADGGAPAGVKGRVARNGAGKGNMLTGVYPSSR